MSLAPFLKSPFTDLTGCLANHQNGSECAAMELEVMECLEAYGTIRGKTKCADIIADFRECAGKEKQFNRFFAMRMERHKQYSKGERNDHFAPPPRPDAY